MACSYQDVNVRVNFGLRKKMNLSRGDVDATVSTPNTRYGIPPHSDLHYVLINGFPDECVWYIMTFKVKGLDFFVDVT